MDTPSPNEPVQFSISGHDFYAAKDHDGFLTFRDNEGLLIGTISDQGVPDSAIIPMLRILQYGYDEGLKLGKRLGDHEAMNRIRGALGVPAVSKTETLQHQIDGIVDRIDSGSWS